ncbi:hypothetical protein [Salinadaptatus halalkaliphilus]|uniref:hypothetical protein n=1 Tax=Salinadaptatus halalkaliphilus TaxID=2419781 RepID=UPI00114121D0|nr:hypothetical protein [Salinadaptatus halalkaliphilus]
MTTFRFLDQYNVEITGQGELHSSLEEYYNRISINTSKDIDLHCHIRDDIGNAEKILGDPRSFYGKSDGAFIHKSDLGSFKIDQNRDYIEIGNDTALHLAFKIIEYQVRKNLAENDICMVHASSVKFNNTTVLFPAWRHTGKTNTLLSLLKNRKASYLSDDRLWVSKDCTAHGFPLPINIEPYNNSMVNESARSLADINRFKLSRVIESRTHKKETFIEKALYFFNEFYITPDAKKIMLEELFNECSHTSSSPIDFLIFLQSHNHNDDRPYMEKISSDQAARYLSSINEYEWNSYIRSICSSSDLLFNRDSDKTDLHQLEETENKVFGRICHELPTYVLFLPQKQDWHEDNLSSRVIEKIESVCL